jgi:hypothetical protein
MECYTFAGTSARWYRIANGHKFQMNRMQASLRHLASNRCTDPIHVIHQSMRIDNSYNIYVLNNPQKYQKS